MVMIALISWWLLPVVLVSLIGVDIFSHNIRPKDTDDTFKQFSSISQIGFNYYILGLFSINIDTNIKRLLV